MHSSIMSSCTNHGCESSPSMPPLQQGENSHNSPPNCQPTLDTQPKLYKKEMLSSHSTRTTTNKKVSFFLSVPKSSLPMASSMQASFLALLVIFNVLLSQAIAARDLPNDSKKVDKKQPEWFIEPDGSMLIPGVGRVMVPGYGSYTPYDGSYGSPDGSTGTDGSTAGTGSYIPGADDTFVPNPGVEVPNPAGGGAIPAAARP